jgi:quinol-cytochrome oxidoreductase complex cytochrome b subunit
MAELVERQPGQGYTPIDEAKRQRLLELVRGRALARPTDLAEDEVMVWPSLVVVEAVSATVFLLGLVVLSVLVNAPLTARANPNQTPNPSKAPWYFLNLQELLLHMNAGLAGVIIPTIALGALAAIPYFDRSPLGVGILGGSAKGRKIIAFTAVYTFVVSIVFVVADEASGRRGFGVGRILEEAGYPEIVYAQLWPSLVILAAIGVLIALVKRRFHPTRRELVIALYTGFFATYVMLTIFGTSFRGEGQELTWPWNLPLEHH